MYNHIFVYVTQFERQQTCKHPKRKPNTSPDSSINLHSLWPISKNILVMMPLFSAALRSASSCKSRTCRIFDLIASMNCLMNSSDSFSTQEIVSCWTKSGRESQTEGAMTLATVATASPKIDWIGTTNYLSWGWSTVQPSVFPCKETSFKSKRKLFIWSVMMSTPKAQAGWVMQLIWRPVRKYIISYNLIRRMQRDKPSIKELKSCMLKAQSEHWFRHTFAPSLRWKATILGSIRP